MINVKRLYGVYERRWYQGVQITLWLCWMLLVGGSLVQCSSVLFVLAGVTLTTCGILSSTPLFGYPSRWAKAVSIIGIVNSVVLLVVLMTTNLADWMLSRAGC